MFDGGRTDESGVVPLTPLGRRAHVSEISGAIAHLAGAASNFVTGTELIVDGRARTVDISSLGLDRFDRGDLVVEGRVV